MTDNGDQSAQRTKKHIHGIRPPNDVYAAKKLKAEDILNATNTSTTDNHQYHCTCKTSFKGLRPVSNVSCNMGLWSSDTQSEAQHVQQHRIRYLEMKQKDRGRIIFKELVHSYRHRYDEEGKRINAVEDGWFDYTVHGKSVCQPIWLSAYPVTKTTLAEWQKIIRANVNEAGAMAHSFVHVDTFLLIMRIC